MTYRMMIEHGKQRLTIAVKQDLLDQVKGGARFWRLDLDEAAGKGRLTGCIQADGHSATREGTVPSTKAASRRFGWLGSGIAHLFPVLPNAVPLIGVTVTSLGIEFNLPTGPAE